MLLPFCNRAECQPDYRVVFWNVENLFDIYDDSTRNDDAFTPRGANAWTMKRYDVKQTHIAKTIVSAGFNGQDGFELPLLVGLAEVENDKVLRDLCRGTPLRRFDYGFVHFDSPDRRGIDVALLYRTGYFVPFLSEAINVSDTAEGFFTRDLLLVEGVTARGDTLVALVCHFPSKLGGTTADKRRKAIAKHLRTVMDSVTARHPSAALVVMGDFNGAPDERELRTVYDGASYVNLMAKVEKGRGSYKYQDYWSCIDQIIVSVNMNGGASPCPLMIMSDTGCIMESDFLLLDDDKFLGRKVFRTFLGPKYQGGYSDHLPVYVDIYRRF